MSASRAGWVGMVVVTTIAGCRRPEPPPPPPPPPPAATILADTRARFEQQNPNVQVGLVIATLPADMLAAVGDVRVDQFRTGDAVVFVDGNLQTIAGGAVLAIVRDTLHVKYQPVDGGRAPQEGDLAVRVNERPVPPVTPEPPAETTPRT